jgi:hypothetical protein
MRLLELVSVSVLVSACLATGGAHMLLLLLLRALAFVVAVAEKLRE